MRRAITICGLLGLAAFVGRAQISPGPLSQAHSSLEGTAKCVSCHSFGLGARKFKCTACHTEIRQELTNKRGFHFRVAKPAPGDQDCARCHTEHLGTQFNIVKWEPSHDDFDHRQTGYSLEGKHARVACARCHASDHVAPDQRKLIRVKDLNRTYLGLSSQCGTCHADEHRGQLNPECSKCHGLESWKPAAGFDHASARYPLTGLHASVACNRCHRPLSDRGKTYVQYKNFPFLSCVNCHRDPHRGSFQGDCQSCHTTGGWKQVRMSGSGFDHDQTKFPLHGAHIKTDCVKCHKTSDFKQPLTFSLCADCHMPDPHKGQFSGQDCGRCHNEETFKPSLYTVGMHETSKYPLAGKHAAVACAKCHIPAGRDTQYHVKHAACVNCHDDAHGGQFAAGPHGNRCEECHTLDGWRPSTFTLAKHQGTRFRLEGGHRATACGECHRIPIGKFPAPPAQYQFASLNCEGCHQDPHRAAGAPPSKEGCEVCHSARSWKDVVAFDHGTTKFPLRGAHRATACAECHRPAGIESTGRHVVFTNAPIECIGCHEDVHGGQFVRDAVAPECSSCHNETSWKPSTFDHEARAKFSLKGAHQQVPCVQCHKETSDVGGRRTVIYQRAPSRCAACHSNL